MRLLLHDPILAMWFFFAICFFAMGFYALAVWFEVRGIRGLAMATLAICLGLLTTLLAWIRVGDRAILSTEMITLGIRIVFPAMCLSTFVIVDLWAADMNGHRSITTILYTRWKKLAGEHKREQREIAKESTE